MRISFFEKSDENEQSEGHRRKTKMTCEFCRSTNLGSYWPSILKSVRQKPELI